MQGYHLGSFRLAEGKMHFYEFDTRIPFLVRGPGIPQGFNLDKIVGSVDLAPTFLDIAGVNPTGLSPPMDGRSILPIVVAPSPGPAQPPQLEEDSSRVEVALPPRSCSPDPCNGHGVCLQPLSPQCFCNQEYAGDRCERCAAGHENYPACTEVPWRDQYLFEYYPTANYETAADISAGVRTNDDPRNCFRALRVHNDTHDLVYAEVTDESKDWFFQHSYHFELYDMRVDEFQLHNIYYNQPNTYQEQLHAELAKLWGCKGADCP